MSRTSTITTVGSLWTVWLAQIGTHTGRDVSALPSHPMAGAWFAASKDSREFAHAWKVAAFDVGAIAPPS